MRTKSTRKCYAASGGRWGQKKKATIRKNRRPEGKERRHFDRADPHRASRPPWVSFGPAFAEPRCDGPFVPGKPPTRSGCLSRLARPVVPVPRNPGNRNPGNSPKISPKPTRNIPFETSRLSPTAPPRQSEVRRQQRIVGDTPSMLTPDFSSLISDLFHLIPESASMLLPSLWAALPARFDALRRDVHVLENLLERLVLFNIRSET